MNTRALSIDWKMSLGNIITIGTVLVSLAIGWTRLEAANAQSDKEIARLVENDKVMKEEIREVREKADAKLELLARDLGEVKQSLRAISTNLEWIVKNSKP